MDDSAVDKGLSVRPCPLQRMDLELALREARLEKVNFELARLER